MALSRRIALRGHVKPKLQAHRVERPRRMPGEDALPVRLSDTIRRLRASSRRLAAAEAVLRALALSGSPDAVGARIVDLAFDWFGGEGWAALGQSDGRGLVWLCDRGVTSSWRSAVTALANHVVDSGLPEWDADASRLGPTRLRTRFGALALPLRSEGRVVAALVGIDRAQKPGQEKLELRLTPAADGKAKLELCPTPGGGKPHGTPGDKSGASLAASAQSASARPRRSLGEGGQVPDLETLWLLLDPLGAALHNAMRLARAEKLSSIDDLTGLYNARFLAGALQRETKRALRTNRPLSVLFVDLDGFKGINDRWGHLSGSRALVEAAARIAAGARETDIVARYGGDEFAIVLPETPAEGGMIVARRVRERIADHSFLQAEGIGYRLTASVGVATLPEAARTPEDLIAAADAAMYRVKARGKNGIELAGSAASQDGKR